MKSRRLIINTVRLNEIDDQINLVCFVFLALPPAEVFSFCLHTAFTELASTSDDSKTRDKVRKSAFL